MAEGLAPSIAGNTAARSNYSPGERGDSGISAHSGWLRSYLLTTLPPCSSSGACLRGQVMQFLLHTGRVVGVGVSFGGRARVVLAGAPRCCFQEGLGWPRRGACQGGPRGFQCSCSPVLRPGRLPSSQLPSARSALTDKAQLGEALAVPGIPLALAFVLARGLGAEGGSIRWPGAASLRVQRWRDRVLCRRPPLHSG